MNMTEFVLVNNAHDDPWSGILEAALRPLGTVVSVREEDAAVREAMEGGHDVVIIDATFVNKVQLLVSRLRAQRPDTRIVVVTASPEWPLARAAFLAGAIDYLQKSSDQDELLRMFTDVLKKRLPSPPR
ncbi:MAG TPA: response regulator [Blastocatellia bacterium]|nr:response regulator [Blastocatellia bacterium]